MRSGLSPRKAKHSLYFMGRYIDEATGKKVDALLQKMGKHKTGASCVYVNKLADIDLSVLEEIITLCWDAMNRKYPDWRWSDPCIPLVIADIFPKAAFAIANVIKAGDRFDSGEIFGVFITQLPLDPHPQGCAVFLGDRVAIELMRDDRLRVVGIDQIDTFVIGPTIQNISAAKDDELRFGPDFGCIQQG